MTGFDIWMAALVGAALVLACGSAEAASGGVVSRTLDNGLEILVQEDHSTPLVCSFIWYRVGLRHEPSGQSGISHFLEHMAFKGTERLSGREMNRLVTARGGYLNGFTSMDYTAYVETLPSDALELAFRIESERMASCTLDPEDIEAEKGVVLSEFEGAENDPGFLLRRRVMAAQFPGQPYGQTVIGDKDDIRGLTRKEVAAYYRSHYAPNNAVLVVVGDVEPEDAFAKAEEYFGPIPSDEPAPPRPNPGRGATGEERVRLEVPGRTSYFQAVYEVPPIQHQDHIALEVLQNVVSSGRTSRLYRALVDSGLAAEAGGWQYESPEPTVFLFEAALRPKVEHAAVERAFDEVIEGMREELVGELELTKSKNKTKATFVYSADGVTRLAHQIGYYDIIYDHRYLEEFPEKVDAITAEDIRRVAQTYFAEDNRTVGWLVATGEEGGTGGAGAAPTLDIQWRPQQHLPAAPEWGALVPPPSGVGDVAPIHEVRLDNGMRIILQENHAAPFVVLYGNIMAGPTFDPPGRAGLAAFCSEMLSRGTEQRSWREIREALETVAADLSFGVGIQVATLGGRCMSGDLELVLEAAAEQIMQPSFPQEELEKVRSEIIAAQARRDEDTMEVAEKELLARLYPEGHPLHSPRLGTSESVSAIARDELIEFHREHYHPQNTILAIVGDIRPDGVESAVKRIFGAWPEAGGSASPELPQVPVPEEPRVVEVPVPNKTQVDIAIGFPGISRGDPDYYRADLMNYVLGRSFMSRLNMRIREELGLAYYVWSFFHAYRGPGPWMLQMGVNPANADKALNAAVEELGRVQEEPPSADELGLWKSYVEGTVARRMETYQGIARELVLASFYDLGLYFAYEYPGILSDITADQVHEAARQFLHPDGYIAVIAGPVGETAE